MKLNEQDGWAIGIMYFLIMAVCVLLCSCGVYYDKAIAANGNSETIVYPFMGGTATVTGANGAHFTHDHQQSFRDGVTAAGTAYSAQQTAKTTINAANNVTTQQANTLNAQTQQAANAAAASNAAAKTAAQEAVTNNAISNGAKVAPITITPP